MTAQNVQAVAGLALIVLAAVAAALAWDWWLISHRGVAGSISSGMRAMGRQSPLLAVIFASLWVGLTCALFVHWWETT